MSAGCISRSSSRAVKRVGGLDESPDALYVVVVGFLHILSSIKSYGQIKRQVAYVFEPFALHQHFKQFF